MVDDDAGNRDTLSRDLGYRGYSVEVAESGQEALEKIEAAHYDLVLLDQIMPGMSGLDLLRLLRATHSQMDLPVIMVSAHSQGQFAVDALASGANDGRGYYVHAEEMHRFLKDNILADELYEKEQQ